MNLTEEMKFKRLRRFNAVMAVVHLVQALLILVLANNTSQPIYSYFLKFDPATQSLISQQQLMFDLLLGPMVALFLFISAFDHFLLAGPLYKWYVAGLKENHNYARWYEYAISSSVMIVVIAVLCGVRDIAAIIPLFAINSVMNLFGLMMEKHNQVTKKTDWTSYIFGTYAGLVPWVVISIYLWGSGVGGRVPDFVYWIYFVIAIFFFSFAFNMVLQYKKVGRWKDYLFGEYVYILLSLFAKSALAWLVFAGTLATGT
ncbi:MAG: heliorhodopsin HeR [Methanomassiliicoccus sp.]|nr:heliorhodopsin HeR [Methanomassiliicoccus sp.]